MTQTIKEIVEEFDKRFSNDYLSRKTLNKLRSFFLYKILEVAESIVPSRKSVSSESVFPELHKEQVAFNRCRQQMIDNIEKLKL